MYMEMIINEETIEHAIELLRKSKGKRVLVAVQNLEDENDDDIVFVPRQKTECEEMIRHAATVVSAFDDFAKQLRVFTSKQVIKDIKPIGYQKTIFLNQLE